MLTSEGSDIAKKLDHFAEGFQKHAEMHDPQKQKKVTSTDVAKNATIIEAVERMSAIAMVSAQMRRQAMVYRRRSHNDLTNRLSSTDMAIAKAASQFKRLSKPKSQESVRESSGDAES